MATQPAHNKDLSQSDIQHTIQPVPAKAARKRAIDTFAQRMGQFLMEKWAHILMIGLGFLVLSALSVPFLAYFGFNFISKPLFYSLHMVCAQVPSHSFYVLGHQLGMCARNLAIYSSMFLGCVIFVRSNKRMPGIPWWVWILMILPMAWDGTTQLFGWRESDWILRAVTGTLFGLGSVWFALPMMQKSLEETTLPPHLTGRPAVN